MDSVASNRCAVGLVSLVVSAIFARPCGPPSRASKMSIARETARTGELSSAMLPAGPGLQPHAKAADNPAENGRYDCRQHKRRKDPLGVEQLAVLEYGATQPARTSKQDLGAHRDKCRVRQHV